MSLSEHMSKRAVESNFIQATREERIVLGLDTGKGRTRRGQRGAKRTNGENGGSADKLSLSSPAIPSSSSVFQASHWAGASNAQNALVPIGPNGVSRLPQGGDGSDSLLVPPVNTAHPAIARIDVLDCTFGGGHHSRAILEEGDPFTRVVALDCDLGVAPEADALAAEFGPKRFRFFGNHMSNALAMFGEKKFDFIIIDPGPNAMQLFDPARGFCVDLEHEHSLDMRYSAKTGTSALRWLEAEEIVSAATAISSVGLVEFRLAHLMLGYIKAQRPLRGSLDVFGALGDGRFGDLPEDLWVSQLKQKELSAASRFLMSLRAVINNELFELQSTVRDSMLLLKPHGHLAVITRHMFEHKAVEKIIEAEPYALRAYSTRVTPDEVKEFGVPPLTHMSLFRLLDKPAAIIKNGFETMSDEKVAASSFSRMVGLHSTVPSKGKYSFPAQNFTFPGFVDESERQALRNNRAGPQLEGEGVPPDQKHRRSSKFGPHRN